MQQFLTDLGQRQLRQQPVDAEVGPAHHRVEVQHAPDTDGVEGLAVRRSRLGEGRHGVTDADSGCVRRRQPSLVLGLHPGGDLDGADLAAGSDEQQAVIGTDDVQRVAGGQQLTPVCQRDVGDGAAVAERPFAGGVQDDRDHRHVDVDAQLLGQCAHRLLSHSGVGVQQVAQQFALAGAFEVDEQRVAIHDRRSFVACLDGQLEVGVGQ